MGPEVPLWVSASRRSAFVRRTPRNGWGAWLGGVGRGRGGGGVGRSSGGGRPSVGRSPVWVRGAPDRRSAELGRVPAPAAAAAGRARLGARVAARSYGRPGVRHTAADRGSVARAARGVRRVSRARDPGGVPQRGLALHVPRSRAHAARAGRGCAARAGSRGAGG